ncbi:MAG TPA: CBS domain-containing protein [Jatrophihabitantaceae bacterium]|jgi:CBS domain-containing protein|nr:CBS domain-containing protein [Jatrophihabitantaceae bacterium]
MKISDILRHKGSTVVTISPSDAVTALVSQLADHKVGALVVANGDTVAGIVSERDVVRRLAERGAAILELTVADIMTTDVVSCDPQDSVDSVAATMTERRIRHMPVISDGGLVGIVSIGDVVLSRIQQLEQDRGQLEQYITG